MQGHFAYCLMEGKGQLSNLRAQAFLGAIYECTCKGAPEMQQARHVLGLCPEIISSPLSEPPDPCLWQITANFGNGRTCLTLHYVQNLQE
jgi:hypothetical protein